VDFSEAYRIEKIEDDAVFALATSVQRGLWLTQLLDGTSSDYNVAHAFRVADDLDADMLSRSLIRILVRHEALRTSFAYIEDELYQVVATPAYDIALLKLISTTDGESLQDVIRQEFARPFDLSSPLLIRTSLITDGNVRVLTIVAHHMIVDADAIGIMIDELTQLYRAEAAHIDVDLAPSPLRPGDYADWERRFVASEVYQRQVDFFRHVLRGTPKAIDFALPVSRSGPRHGGVVSITLPRSVAAGLFAHAASAGATPFAALLTLYAGVLHRWTDQDVVVIGTSVSVRSEPGLERAVGMFVNSQPIPTRWGDDPSFVDAFRQVSETVVECLARYRCPFDRLVADLKPDREPGRAPIFQVMFGYRDDTLGQNRPGWPLLAEIRMPVETAKFELSLDATVIGGEVLCELEWSAERFNADAAACFAEHLALAAECASRDVSSRIGEVPLFPIGPTGPGLFDLGRLTQPFPPLAPTPYGE
jgi:hypothetical protein